MEPTGNKSSCGEEAAEDFHGDRKEYLVSVFVNDHSVKVLGHAETGREIKSTAIEQGVHIHLNFELEEEMEDGSYRAVEDHDKVQLREHMRFRAQKPAVVITVNEQPVEILGNLATGAEIKTAAIAQAVHIQLNFVLQEELPNGTSKIIGDSDEVRLRKNLRFTAIAPDDNS